MNFAHCIFLLLFVANEIGQSTARKRKSNRRIRRAAVVEDIKMVTKGREVLFPHESDLDIPYANEISGGHAGSFIFHLYGKVALKPSKIEIAFSERPILSFAPSSSILFYIQVDFETSYIYHCTYDLYAEYWSIVEKISHPFEADQFIDLRIKKFGQTYELHANRRPIGYLNALHYTELEKVKFMRVDGSLTRLRLCSLRHDDINWNFVSNQFVWTLPDPFYPGTRLDLSYIIDGSKFNHGAQAFPVNLISASGNIPVHLNIRCDEKAIVRNNIYNGEWGAEERDGDFPLDHWFFSEDICLKNLVDLTIISDVNGFRIFVNKKFFATFTRDSSIVESISTALLPYQSSVSNYTQNEISLLGDNNFLPPYVFTNSLPLKKGHYVLVKGWTSAKKSDHVITIKIESHGSDADEAPYILELRYGENSVMAFMHTAGGRLSNEQQLPHTLKSNELFDIRTFLVNWDILVYLNRRYLGMFHVNHPLAGHFMRTSTSISGDIHTLQAYRNANKNYLLPYTRTRDYGLSIGSRLDITFVPQANNIHFGLYKKRYASASQFAFDIFPFLKIGIDFKNKKIIRSGYNSSLSQMGLEEYDGEWPFDTPNYKLNQVIDLTVKHEESQFKIFINGNYHSRFGKQYNLNHDKSYYGPREVRASEYILILDQTISYIDLDDYVSVNLSEKDD